MAGRRTPRSSRQNVLVSGTRKNHETRTYDDQSALTRALGRAIAEKYGVGPRPRMSRPYGAAPSAHHSPVSEFWTAQTAKTARDPEAWRSTVMDIHTAALALRAAITAKDDGVRHLAVTPIARRRADRVHPNPALWRIYLLLAGLALENLAKSVIVGQHPELVTREGLSRDWPGTGHRLRELFRRAGINLSWEETRLVLGLQRYVEWGGRYPVPKQFRGGVPRTYYGVAFRWPDAFSPQREPAVYEALFDRVAKHQRNAGGALGSWRDGIRTVWP